MHRSKNVSIGLWSNSHSRASLLIQRGPHFGSIGHPVRSTPQKVNANIVNKVPSETRIHLLPEEVLYLVERGSMMCYEYDWTDNTDSMLKISNNDNEIENRICKLPPMSAQRAFDETLGKDGLTVEKYMVYAQLKRLGYIVQRPKSEHVQNKLKSKGLLQIFTSFIYRTFTFITRSISSLFSFRFQTLLNSRSNLFKSHETYDSIFNSLRLVKTGFEDEEDEDKYKLNEKEAHEFDVTWHVWKPTAKFKKTAPPPPDFRVVVVNSFESALPKIEQFSKIFDELPESTPPLSRRQKLIKEQEEKKNKNIVNEKSEKPMTLMEKLKTWFRSSSISRQKKEELKIQKRDPRVMFPALKYGKKVIIMAIVDSGTTSWIQFGQGHFNEFPLLGDSV